MDKSEEVFVSLFSSLREDLREEYGVGLALKAEGRNITLRVRSEKKPGDEKQPHFALVVGVRDGAFRISYKPSGVPSADSQVTIVGADATDRLLGLVRGYVEKELRRLMDYQQNGRTAPVPVADPSPATHDRRRHTFPLGSSLVDRRGGPW